MVEKLVFNPKVARRLLKNGYVISDIKPNRDDTKKTVFVFRVDDENKFFNDLDKFSK